MNELGIFLRKLRGKMTFREAEERSGVSHSYIRYLEVGKRPGTNTPINPSPDMLKGLAKAYNHSYKDLMVRAGYSYEEKEEAYIEETELERKKNKLKNIIDAMNDESELDYTAETIERLRRK